MNKKLLSIFMAVLMILGLTPVFPMTAFAATVTVSDEAGLRSAITSASTGDIIGLTQDITLTADLTINKNVTIASAGAKLIAEANRIIIPSGSSVSFGGTLGITGNAATGYNDGLVVVLGTLTLFADQVSIANSYASGGNSSAIYVETGTLDIQGGSISDTSGSASLVSYGICLNGGSVSLDAGGSAISVSGSGSGIYARSGADVSMYAGSVSGNTGISFSGTNGGSVSVSGGSVIGSAIGLSISNAAAGSAVTGGIVTGISSYGILADESILNISGGAITGHSGDGGVYSQGGSTVSIYRGSTLSVVGGIRTADGSVSGAAFLTELPAPVSLPVNTDGSVPLSLGTTAFTLTAADTAASLRASYSAGTVSLHPTAVGTNLPLVLRSSVIWNDGDYDFTETLKLTMPVTVTGAAAPTVATGAVSGLSATGATVAGGVTTDGGAAPNAYGVVYGTAENPTTADSAAAGSGTAAAFTAALTGLLPNTTYHARAYAVNSAGTSYGGDVSFMTLSNSGAMIPTVSTGNQVIGADAGLPANQLYAYGSVNKQGFSEVTQRGILYYKGDTSPDAGAFTVSTNPYHDPAILQVPASTKGGGEYRVLITNDRDAHYYWFRAYAINSDGVSYGSIEATKLSGTLIHISTEAGGSIAAADGTVLNQNGAMYWNGTSWVTNDTAAHMYFTSLLTGERLTPLRDVAVSGNETYSYTNALGSISVTVDAQNYSYEAAAAAGGSYTYTGREYRISAVYTDTDAGTTVTDEIVLRSKGVGSGTDNAYFDTYIQVSGSSDITAILSDPNWLTFSGMTMEQALAASETGGTVSGSFVTPDANYYMDLSGGAEMGGRSYLYHTGTFDFVNTSDASALYSKSFTLRYLGDAEAINLNFEPQLFSETYTPAYTGGPGGESSGYFGTAYFADVKKGDLKTDSLPVTVDNARTGTASLNAAKTAELFNSENASVVMPDISGVTAYTLELPASALAPGQKSGGLTIKTTFASMTIPESMLSNITGADGKTAGITVAKGDASGLTDAEKAAVGSRPLVRLTLTLGGERTEWSNPGSPVTVTIPYTPTAEELKSPESILIWYLNGSGTLTCVPNGHYDSATGTVTFTASRFSQYAVGCNPVSFNDVASGAWYYDAVSFIAARGITIGTGSGNFSPDAMLTRGEFIVLLMRAYCIAPDESPKDNFSDAGSTYYTGYLAAAKRLGIAQGVGKNNFAPGQAITRQELFTLLYRALDVLEALPTGESGKTLSDFSDAGQIASWAKETMTLLVETGTIVGSDGTLNPKASASRAYMARVLYKLLLKP